MHLSSGCSARRLTSVSDPWMRGREGLGCGVGECVCGGGGSWGYPSSESLARTVDTSES